VSKASRRPLNRRQNSMPGMEVDQGQANKPGDGSRRLEEELVQHDTHEFIRATTSTKVICGSKSMAQKGAAQI
jgi:hypothetical protein